MKTTKSTAKTMRPSPSASATLYPVGKTMKGNDGNLWKIAKTKDGVKRWNKVTTASKSVSKPAIKTKSAPAIKSKREMTVGDAMKLCFKDTCNYIATGKHLSSGWKKNYEFVNEFIFGVYIPHQSHMRGFAYRLASTLKHNGNSPFVNRTLREYGLKMDIGEKEIVKK
jgi:DNA-directed RNA polymerase